MGVRPEVSVAEKAGVAVDRGMLVDEYLRTSAPDVFAAGDIARWPDSHSGERIRVQHWVVAVRQGQAAARNMMGKRERFDAVPFFWSMHYDVGINCVGHAAAWDRIEIVGSFEDRNAAVRYIAREKAVALATIYRDLMSLQFERQLELRAQGPGRSRLASIRGSWRGHRATHDLYALSTGSGLYGATPHRSPLDEVTLDLISHVRSPVLDL